MGEKISPQFQKKQHILSKLFFFSVFLEKQKHAQQKNWISIQEDKQLCDNRVVTS